MVRSGLSQQDLPSSWMPRDALPLVRAALEANPEVEAARQALLAEQQRALAVDGFFDSQLAASGAWSEGPVTTPGAWTPGDYPGHAVSAQAGVVLPLRPGVKIGAGVAQRRLLEPDGFEDLGQTTAGVRMELPLQRDRGFRSQNWRQSAADETAAALAEQVQATRQRVTRDVLQAYAGLLHAAADLREASNAVQRVQALGDETAARVALKATAEYQLFSARLEIAFRQEELRQAHAVLANARHRLEQVVGQPAAAQALVADPAALRVWAADCAGLAERAPQPLERPELRRAERLCAAADWQSRVAREQTRSDVALGAGVGYQAEDEAGGFGREPLLDRQRGGFEAAIVWRRPWSFDAEKARVRASEADADALRAALRALRLQIAAEQAQAAVRYAAACDRLGWVDAAVAEGRRALAAEEERLRLGEGRSRNVLDAQKDLTDAERRANAAALDTVAAFLELLHARGVPLPPA